MDRSPTRDDARSPARSTDERTFESAAEERDSISTERDLLEEEVDLDPEIEALMGFAQMDLEAATSYETAAECISEKRLSEMLHGFAQDHLQHVSEIRRLVTQMGADTSFASPDPAISTFATVTAAATQFGTDAALRSLIAGEQFTNSTYEAALELVTSPEARAVMERNLRDEQRHLRALTQEYERTRAQEEDRDRD